MLLDNKYYKKYKKTSYDKLINLFATTEGEEKTIIAFILANKCFLDENNEGGIKCYQYVIEQLEKVVHQDFETLDTLVICYDNLAECYENDCQFKNGCDCRDRVVQLCTKVLLLDSDKDLLELYESIYDRNVSSLSCYYLDLEGYESLIDIHYGAILLYNSLKAKGEDVDKQLAENYYCLAQSYSFQEDYTNCVTYAYEAANLYEKIGVSDNLHNASYLGDSYKLIAYCHDDIGDEENAQLYLDKAIEIYDMLADVDPKNYSNLLGTTYLTAASMVESYGRFDDALLYLKKGIASYQNVDLSDDSDYQALANIYFRLAKLEYHTLDDNFINTANKAVEMIETLIYEKNCKAEGIDLALSVLYATLKEYYIKLSDFEKADYYDSLLEALEETKNQ